MHETYVVKQLQSDNDGNAWKNWEKQSGNCRGNTCYIYMSKERLNATVKKYKTCSWNVDDTDQLIIQLRQRMRMCKVSLVHVSEAFARLSYRIPLWDRQPNLTYCNSFEHSRHLRDVRREHGQSRPPICKPQLSKMQPGNMFVITPFSLTFL
jgi:hypothetical protein